MKINHTHINNTVKKNIIKAMFQVLRQGNTVAHVYNRKGQAFLVIRLVNDKWFVSDASGQNIKKHLFRFPTIQSKFAGGLL